jgi:type VI secretion system protein ImpL
MPHLSPWIAALAPYLPYAAILLLILLVGVAVVTLIYVARRREEEATPAASAAAPVTSLPPETAPQRRQALFGMRAASRRLQGTDLAYDHPYSVPWFVLLGGIEAQPRRLTEALEPADPSDPSANSLSGKGYRVAFAKEGAIVEVDAHLLGAPGWIERWELLLWLLRGARPERPADGLVLAVPVSWLIGPDALPADRLADHGAQLYEAIWRFQRHTGLRVPIYLALTRAEGLDGFRSLADTVAVNLRDEVLGWSAPDGLIDAFDPEEVAAAIETLVTGLGALHLQIMGAAQLPASFRDTRQSAAGDMLLLPGGIRRLGDPLRILLTAMLRTSVYHEPFLFRGFYLTGSVAGAGDLGHEAFARGLFRRKIFREFQMARPARGVITRRNRRLRIAQICLATVVLAAIVGLGASSVILPRRAALLAPTLNILERETAQQGQPSARGPTQQVASLDPPVRIDQPALERRVAESLLWSFSYLPLTTVSLAAPTSLLETPDIRVIKALAVGYDRFVLEAIRDGLQRRGHDLLNGIAPRDPAACGNPAAEGVPNAADIARFQTLASATQLLDQNVRLYASMSRNHSVPTLALLSHYALDLEMPADFNQDTRLYRLALEETKAPPVDVTALRKQLQQGIADGLVAAASAQFDAGAVSQAISAVTELSIEVNAPGLDGARVVDLLRQLRAQLTVIQNAVAGTGFAWVGSTGNLGPAIEQPLTLLRQANLDLVPAPFVDELERMGQSCRLAAQHNLMALAGLGGIPVLQATNGTLVMSQRFKALAQGLDELFAENFMKTASATIELGSPGRRLAWDAPLVGTAEQALERYSAIMTSSVGSAPIELRGAFRTAAQYQLVNFVLGRVSAARRVRPDDGGFGGDDEGARRGEIRNFAAVAPVLSNLDSGLNQLGLGQAAAQISDIAVGQARRLLGEVSRRLDDETLYQPIDPGFAWWTGDPPLAARSFGAATPADLVARLGAERDFIGALAQNEAQPLVSFLNHSGDRLGDASGQITLGGTVNRGDDAARWAGIIDALGKYDRKAPESTLGVLENFILVGMDQIDLTKCRDAVGVPAPAFDYFGGRLQRLERGLLDRCTALQRSRIEKQYGEVASLFNRTLAGRFPFVAATGVGKIAAWADPDDVRRFYKALDQGTGGPMAGWMRAAYGPSAATAVTFLEQIDALRPALAPLIADASPDQPPTWEADVEFRANPELDQAGNQVLEWSLDGLSQHVSSLQAKQSFVWSYGQPVKLSLRWARNAPSIPAADQTGQPVIRDVTASWSYPDPWGLISLIEDRGATRETFLPISARRPETVILKLPLMKNPEAVAGGDAPGDRATLFVRIRLHAVQHVAGQPDKRVPVTLGSFPTSAPPL